MDWQTRDRQVLWHPFTQHDEWDRLPMLCIERGEGMYLIDTDGKRYLDGVSSLWCNLFGHRHPRLDAAVQAQLERIAHSTLLGLSHPNAVVLAEKLVAAAAPLGGGLRRVFYSDSGSTATEVALKMAFQAQQQRGQRQRIRFAALSEAYHGDTLGAVGVGGIPLFHQVYQPLLTQALRIPAPERPDPVEEAACLREAEALFAAHGEQVAAFIFEPLVQGAAEGEEGAAAPEGAEGEEGAAPKKKLAGKTLILFVVLPLLLVGLGGGAAAVMFLGKKPAEAHASEEGHGKDSHGKK
ncbi:MAG TPA: aminotransferase class III-fold pyridoxal phosphate-dependent enzyme, partial [Myxococcota bacterium]|nr:aminotransferase class III-fold pyridoxal phosphate-dependent enzyme [Myxococcota bacterium]